MPQPLKKGTTVFFQGNAVAARPALAKHIGIIIGLWSDLDARRAQLLSDILKIEASLATAMYLSVESDGGKQAILIAAVRERFPDLLEEFTKLSTSVSNTSRERNRVAHGVWGLSNQNSETLIWEDPKDAVLQRAYVFETGDKILSRQPAPPDHRICNLGSLREYKEGDFIAIEQRIQERIEELRLFGLKIWKRSRGL